jgi:tight adherence protein B
MGELLIGGVAAFGAGAIAWVLRQRRLRAMSLRRLAEPLVPTRARAEERILLAPALPRYTWAPPLVAVIVSVGLYLALSWPPVLCVAIGLVTLVLGHMIEVNVHESRSVKLETQLADAIDMIVGALGAGAGTMDALDGAGAETRQPLRSELQALVGRIRYGDQPQVVMRDLAERIPLETFQLFAFTLAVHDETGGSLTGTLATVGRTIRDRIELRRRVRAEATQAQFSSVMILFITYGIALITWISKPERMEGFLGSEAGIRLVSAAMLLQGIGLLWMFRLSRIKY